PRRGISAAQGGQRTRLPTVVLCSSRRAARHACSAPSRAAEDDRLGQGLADPRSATSPPSHPLPCHILACRSRLSRPRDAWFLAPTRYWHSALVTLRSR